MTAGLDPLVVVRRRLQAQRLGGGGSVATAAEAVAWSGAVQAQEYAGALWSLGMRVRDVDATDVEAACDRGEILRTHVMRPTWHFVAAADLRWLLRLTAPRVQAKNAGRYRDLGLDDATRRRCEEALTDVLADGEPRTRRELGGVLKAAAGIETSGQRLPHALMSAELEGVIASGPRRGRQHTYLLLDGRIPDAPQRSREDDVAELVCRYFTSHGPATLRDFAWWSGLTIADAKRGVAAAGESLTAEPVGDGTRWIAPAAPAAGPPLRTSGALLLGTFDELLVAYRALRNVDAGGRPGNELLSRPIVVDGVTVGTWTRQPARRDITIEAVLDAPPDDAQRAGLRAAVDRFGAFLGLPARLRLEPQRGR